MGDRITYYYSSVSSNLEVSVAFKVFFDAKVIQWHMHVVGVASTCKCIFPTANSILFGSLAAENSQGGGILWIATRSCSVTR